MKELPPKKKAVCSIMAMTFVCVHQTKGATSTLRLFVSNEYIPTKERDVDGKVLPNQKWQHPDPKTLRYTEMGTGISGPGSHFTSIVQTMMEHGMDCFGGHGRLITEGTEEILRGRTQSWDQKLAEDEERREAEQYREREIERQEREPVYEYCSRCDRQREACKNYKHRGDRRCMECCGGIGDAHHRHCRNCLDLPYREMREKALGEPIVYEGESERESVS